MDGRALNQAQGPVSTCLHTVAVKLAAGSVLGARDTTVTK